MDILCLDLEGVLVPEVWQAVARETGIDALNKTTRDIPVYDDLMRMRLGVLAEHEIRLSSIQTVIAGLEPLPGAVEFMAWARERFQVVVLSDTFYDFAKPLMAKLSYPVLLCHKLVVEDDRIVDYRIRQEDPKRQAVRAFHGLNFRVLAAGDSFNDLGMLDEADKGIFINAPEGVLAQYPSYASVRGYDELKAELTASANR